MKYKYTYRTTAWELWQLSMYYTYGSLVGLCNVIFTAAVILLTIRQWETAGMGYRLLLVCGCCLFTVIQPLVVYQRARKQAGSITQDMELGVDEAGIHIRSGGQSSDLKWNIIKKVSRKPTMIIIFSNTTHGFVLTNRVLGGQKEEFYRYVVSKVDKQRR